VKDDFLAVVSHELRTPLNAISGWIGLLRGGTLTPDKTRHALETIDRNARSQTQLIDDLLDVSRIISGKLHVQMELVNFENLVRLAYDAIEPTALAKKLKFNLAVEPGAYDVTGDPGRLQQVVWNLLNNAVKFTPAEGTVNVLLHSDDRVRLTVSDSGCGVGAGILPFIFDRFRQAEGSVTRRYGGLGLGLAIVKHLVELHGGAVSAESAGEGKGATFFLELGHARPNASNQDEPSPDSTAQSRATELKDVHVLIVDDDSDCRDVLAHLLSVAGARFSMAHSARSALDSLDRELPDVVVSDIGMPGEDGFALIKQIRARSGPRGGKLPVVALTAYARSEDRSSALRAGFNAHVAKPIQSTELITVIASLCGRFS
jgi:CheY-like chemotaxis protein